MRIQGGSASANENLVWMKKMACCFREEQYDWLGVYDHFSGSLGNILSNHHPSDAILHLGWYRYRTVLLYIIRYCKMSKIFLLNVVFSPYLS